ncbi:hypothetical protein [Acuticoccus kandeliae]|uniref:hypothetical protein n=1 Tax=Acuticoccus kandeliae TaxID=2073160 RepID=UPI000D3E3964|nr:hypothetical protein [Acuticoccus kandeliae]
MLGLDAPDAFKVGYHARKGDVEIIELVLPPETVETWTQLITLLMFYDTARARDADGYYADWRKVLREGCPAVTERATRGTVDARPALRFSVFCPRHPQSGLPEAIEGVLVEGEVNLMMVQVAFRRTPNAADAALAARLADTLKVCDQRTFDACRARTPTGFRPED